MKTATIAWTWIDEAPALASHALLPVVQGFLHGAGVVIETPDISLAGRILAAFPERLREEARVADHLAQLGELAKTPAANILKLPNISASIPQLQAAITELQEQGHDIPDYPQETRSDEDRALAARYAKVLGSAVNPVLREGNSDRRAAPAVKRHAQAKPHRMMKPWPEEGSRARVAHMDERDYFATERSLTTEAPTTLRLELVEDDGVSVLKDGLALQAGEILDSAVMNVAALRAYFAREMERAKEEGALLSLHLKATMMKVSDPIMFGHAVSVFFAEAFERHAEVLEAIGFEPDYGLADLESKLERLPVAAREALEADLQACYDARPALAMVDSRRGITNLHLPNNVIIDASMPNVVRDGGKMWNAQDELQDTVALIPDRSYATLYQAVIEDCQRHGQLDPSSMGAVSNVGLMAQKAEEYGSHDKTFEIPRAGTVRVVDSGSGAVLMEQAVEPGDIFRACQTKDLPVRDWVGLAVRRARASGSPAVFWLDRRRAHDRELIRKLERYLPEHDTEGLDIRILAPEAAMTFTLARVRRGEDSIAVTGNVLRDYLTDLFPILELGTSARMLSIVPLLEGGGLFETGAGGSAPKHVQQFLDEGHLRWDSLGEYCALVPSLELAASQSGSAAPAVLARTLDEAVGAYLEDGRSPSRKVGELDNRGSTFYLALYWARALATQRDDVALADRFAPVAAALAKSEATILAELNAAQGTPVDIGGYFRPDGDKTAAAMRPSPTFNAIIDPLRGG